jgi:hypothetical protein
VSLIGIGEKDIKNRMKEGNSPYKYTIRERHVFFDTLGITISYGELFSFRPNLLEDKLNNHTGKG